MLLAVFGSSAALFGCGSGETSGADVQSHQVLSPVYSIDGIYRSMMGPQSTRPVKLGDAAKPELLWITGFRTEMVESDGETPAPPEFMCHSNLDWNAKHCLFHHHEIIFTRMNISITNYRNINGLF